MINKIKKRWRYITKDRAEMCNIMDEARNIVTFSHKDAAYFVINTLFSKPYLLEHREIRKTYHDFVRIYK